MHFHFNFTLAEVLWTVTFAAQLVLLVVLWGRDRVKRFQWFTASIVVVGLRLITQRLLYNRMAPLEYNAIVITLADLGALAGLMVLVELAWQAFGSVKRRTGIVWAIVLVALGAGVLAVWGPWPAWATLNAKSQMAVLMLMQLVAQKAGLLANVLTVALGVLMALFGRRYHAGWRSHTQQIMIGLSTAAMAQLAVQGIWQIIVAVTEPKSQAELDHVLGLRDKIYGANNAVYLAVLVWWIVCLWSDEPGTAAAIEMPAQEKAPLPEYLLPSGADPVPEETPQEAIIDPPAEVEDTAGK